MSRRSSLPERLPRTCGYTLLELVIYIALSALVLLVIASLFTISQRTQQHTYASYLVGGRVASAVRMIRRDLQMTALASIQVYPDKGNSSQAPGFSFVSAYSSDKGELVINNYGVPCWQKHVFYTLRAAPGKKTGQLVRWQEPIADKNFLPTLASMLPSAVQGKSAHVLLSDVVLPGVTVQGVGPGGRFKADQWGGLEVKFVRRAGGEDGPESLTSVNPSKAEAPQDNTRLVQVSLRTLLDESSSTPSLYELDFRVCPRY